MKRHSLTRRLISSVLLVELVFALAVIFLAAAYERHAHLHDFDIMLQGRAEGEIEIDYTGKAQSNYFKATATCNFFLGVIGTF